MIETMINGVGFIFQVTACWAIVSNSGSVIT